MNQDFKELLRLFAGHSVEYLVVGGYAVVHHTQPRYTKDLDLWINPTKENAMRVAMAFGEFGVPMVEVTMADLENEGLQFTIGIEPSAIDFLTTVPGLSFPETWQHRLSDSTLGFEVFYIGLDDLLKAKATSGRPVDLADIDELRRAKKIKGNP